MIKTAFICSTCAVQYEPSQDPPAYCKICTDDRQYVNQKGQQWTSLPQINSSLKNIVEKVAEQLYAIYTTPAFGIGQRAHLLKTESGNILWDCIANLDNSTFDIIQNLGGINAIAISHPHYYSTMAEWSKQFGNIPVFIHASDKKWLTRTDFNLILWEGSDKNIWENVKLINCAGHFPGGSVLYYSHGKGSLLTGDVIQISPDLKSVSMMYSYPNLIPLAKKEVFHIQQSLEGLRYNAMYGAFGNYIRHDAEAILKFSIDRYLRIYD